MRIWQYLLIGAGAMAAARAEGIAPASNAVTICMHPEPDPPAISQAQAIASGIFGEIGLALDWQSDGRLCAPSGNGVAVKVLEVSRRLEHPGAFAYSTPYGRRLIVVFYDRIRRAVGIEAVAPLLAHVLAHEIAHTLQRSQDHSLHGIMKSHWTREELREMQHRRLQFQPFDILLIQQGMTLPKR